MTVQVMEHSSTLLGHTATLHCPLKLTTEQTQLFSVQWWKDGSKAPLISFPNKNKSQCSEDKNVSLERCRFSLKNQGKGDNSFIRDADLLISNVQDKDDGLYKCKVEFLHKENGKKKFVSKGIHYIHLTLLSIDNFTD